MNEIPIEDVWRVIDILETMNENNIEHPEYVYWGGSFVEFRYRIGRDEEC